MSLTVEITEQALSLERQVTLADLLVRTAGMEPDEAALTALVMPCAIGPMPSAEAQQALLAALQQAGFAARAGVGAPEATYSPAPAYSPPAYQQPAYPPTYQQPGYPPPGPYAPQAAGPYAPTPAPRASSNTALIAIAAVLAVAVIALAAILWTRSQDTPGRTPSVSTTDTPPGYGSTPIAGSDDATTAGTTAPVADAEPAYVEPVRSDGADYALGYSPNQGVNWSLFSQGAQTRYAAAPNRTPIPVRDAPSGRHGRALADVPPGGAVQTDGCLPPRPEDGGRWCRTDYAGGEGWVYDRYLRASAPAPPRSTPTPSPSPSPRTSTADVPNVIVMGSYAPGDQAGLEARLAQARQTGLALQVVPASNYGMNGDYQVIVSGPYDYTTTLRLLDQVRRYVPDAFRKALD